MTNGQDTTLTPEQTDALLNVALTGFASGFLTALVDLEVPAGHARRAAKAAVDGIYADPIARNALADIATALFTGAPCPHHHTAGTHSCHSIPVPRTAPDNDITGGHE